MPQRLPAMAMPSAILVEGVAEGRQWGAARRGQGGDQRWFACLVVSGRSSRLGHGEREAEMAQTVFQAGRQVMRNKTNVQEWVIDLLHISTVVLF